MNEPSVLDYVLSLLDPRIKEKISIPALPVEEGVENSKEPFEFSKTGSNKETVATPVGRPENGIPWYLSFSLVFGFFGQRLLEPPARSALVGGGLLFLSMIFLVFSIWKKELTIAPPKLNQKVPQQGMFGLRPFFLSMGLAVLAVLLFLDGVFTFWNTIVWGMSIFFFIRAFWVQDEKSYGWIHKIYQVLRQEQWRLSINRRAIVLVIVILTMLFFRFYNLQNVPAEPFSDHAEKLLDVFNITQGNYYTYFERNTGREFLQFYVTAFLAVIANMGLTFMALKTGTVLIGLVALPFIYGLGKMVGGWRVGVMALVLASVSYWLNTISRIGLRFPLYPAFAAPALYFLVKGLQRNNRNDFILSGIFLGLGLHGYSPARIVPFALLAGIIIYWLHKKNAEWRSAAVFNFLVLTLASVLVFVPLLSYTLTHPDIVLERTMTRISGVEKALDEPALTIFLRNNINAFEMFNYNNGDTWVHSIPYRPALDIVTAVLFVLGLLVVTNRYIRHRYWMDLYLIVLIPVLVLPSTLSLAFPSENPSLNRTGGAAIVVMVIAALALDTIYRSLRRWSPMVAPIAVSAMLIFSAWQNYDLVFNQFASQFRQNAWNTSDMGNVIADFVAAGNDPNLAFVVPWPHWADTRLVGIQAGFPTKDYALPRERLGETIDLRGNKLFLLNEQDVESQLALKELYPTGLLNRFSSKIEGKSFLIFNVSNN